jgi:hypothetical protein
MDISCASHRIWERDNLVGRLFGVDVIEAPKPEPRIMRYELTDFEWAAIGSFG